jgi:hypothetical protein
VLRANQRDGYAALMKATAEAIIVSATQGFGIAPGAIMLRAPVSSWRLIGLKAQDRSTSPRRREIVPQPHPEVLNRAREQQHPLQCVLEPSASI